MIINNWNAREQAAIARILTIYWEGEVKRLQNGANESQGTAFAPSMKLSDLGVVLGRLLDWPRSGPEGM